MAAEAAHFQRRSDQAEQELAALAALATSDAEKARVALLRFDNIFLEGSADLQILDDTLALITDPFWREELTDRRLFVTAISSGPRETMEAASTSIQRPDSASRSAVLQASIRMGRLDQAIEELTPPPGSRPVPAPDEPWHQWALFGLRAVALVHSGRLGEADEFLTMAYREVMDHPAAKRGLSSPYGSPSFTSSRVTRRERSAGPPSPTPSSDRSAARASLNDRMP